MIPVQKIYDATRGGLDIILWMYPQAADCVGAKGKKFKVRCMNFYQIKNSQFVSDTGCPDIFGILMQTGLMPA